MLGHFGTLSSQLDNWSTGLRITKNDGTATLPGDTALTTFLESISGPVATFHGAAGTLAGTSTFLDYLSAAVVGTDGKYYVPSSTTIMRPYGPVIAGGGTPTQPWNTSLVCSMRTNFQRGYASNGRMYWPTIAASVNSATGRVSSSLATLLGLYKTMFDAINSSAETMSAGARISVMSAVGQGHFSPVRSLRMDPRLDSIERRENAQPSVWTTVNLA